MKKVQYICILCLIIFLTACGQKEASILDFEEVQDSVEEEIIEKENLKIFNEFVQVLTDKINKKEDLSEYIESLTINKKMTWGDFKKQYNKVIKKFDNLTSLPYDSGDVIIADFDNNGQDDVLEHEYRGGTSGCYSMLYLYNYNQADSASSYGIGCSADYKVSVVKYKDVNFEVMYDGKNKGIVQLHLNGKVVINKEIGTSLYYSEQKVSYIASKDYDELVQKICGKLNQVKSFNNNYFKEIMIGNAEICDNTWNDIRSIKDIKATESMDENDKKNIQKLFDYVAELGLDNVKKIYADYDNDGKQECYYKYITGYTNMASAEPMIGESVNGCYKNGKLYFNQEYNIKYKFFFIEKNAKGDNVLCFVDTKSNTDRIKVGYTVEGYLLKDGIINKVFKVEKLPNEEIEYLEVDGVDLDYVDLDDESIPVNFSNQYKELGKEEELILYFTEAKDNKDNTYTLYGTVFAPYVLSEEQVKQIKKLKKVKFKGQYYTFPEEIGNSKIYKLEPISEIRYGAPETLYIVDSSKIGYYLFETKIYNVSNEALENGAVGQGAVLRAIDDYRSVTIDSSYEIDEGCTVKEWINDYFKESLPKSIYNLGTGESYSCYYIDGRIALSLITSQQ